MSDKEKKLKEKKTLKQQFSELVQSFKSNKRKVAFKFSTIIFVILGAVPIITVLVYKLIQKSSSADDNISVLGIMKLLNGVASIIIPLYLYTLFLLFLFWIKDKISQKIKRIKDSKSKKDNKENETINNIADKVSGILETGESDSKIVGTIKDKASDKVDDFKDKATYVVAHKNMSVFKWGWKKLSSGFKKIIMTGLFLVYIGLLNNDIYNYLFEKLLTDNGILKNSFNKSTRIAVWVFIILGLALIVQVIIILIKWIIGKIKKNKNPS